MEEQEVKDFITNVTTEINDIVFYKVYQALQTDPSIRENLNPAFPYPRQLRLGILKNCFVVEYIGPEIDEEEKFQTIGIYQPRFNIFNFMEVNISKFMLVAIPWNESIENMVFFLGDSIGYLCDYFYDITQMPAEFICLNGFLDFSQVSKPIYISNTTFFWTDKNGGLKIRHIDFLEIFPFVDGDVAYHDRFSLNYFANFIINMKVPKYKIRLHQVLNEFIELINLPNTDELKITNFLEKNPKILQIAFGTHKLNAQVILEWQYESSKPNLKPDFLIERMDGYVDILEFKLQNLKTEPIVGSEVRSHPSFEVDSAISQIEQYNQWCAQDVNRQWLEREKNIKVMYPIKYLVIGHSENFTAKDRQKLRETRDTVVFTYDEFIEMARFQIYRIR